ncbi:MAG TPA: thiolase family protein [Amycolatopsis sp.]|nr:thiolase family protein [Amycolatopsis sp.]
MTAARIAGVAELPRAELEGIADPVGANAIAIARAAEDAGLPVSSIDAVLTYDSLLHPHPMQATKVCEYLGIAPSFASTIGAGGASPLFGVVVADSLVRSGVAHTVAIAHSDFRASAASRSAVLEKMAAVVGHPEFEDPVGPIVPTLYALVASWLIAEGEFDREDLAAIAVQTRQWARLNPQARFTTALTEAEVVQAPVIAGPLGRFDCCLVTDFSGAVIVRGGSADPRRAVPIAGVAGAVSHEEITQVPGHPMAPLRRTADAVYRAAGIGPSDVDAAFLYDSFTVTVAAQLLGYRLDGADGLKKLLAGNGIGPGGRLPVNTHGGLLSASTSGILHIAEAVRQLRGEAGQRQAGAVGTALVTGVGGVLSHNCAAILRGAGHGG